MQAETITKKNIAPKVRSNVPWHVIKVKPLANYKFEVEFIDGTHGLVEMKQQIMSPEAGVFAWLRDIDTFNQVYVELGVTTWPNGLDLAPDAMYDEIKANGVWVLE